MSTSHNSRSRENIRLAIAEIESHLRETLMENLAIEEYYVSKVLEGITT